MTSIIKQTGTIERLLYKYSKSNDYNFAFIAVIGFVCGYPSSSRLIGQSNIKEPLPLYALSTAPSPIFLTGSIATVFLGNSSLSIYLLCATYLSLVTSYVILSTFRKNKLYCQSPPPKANYIPFGDMLKTAIIDGVKAQMIILGIIITVSLFTVTLKHIGVFNTLTIIFTPIANVLHIPAHVIPSILQGLLEMSSGTHSICQQNISIHHKLLLCGFITSFGGLSIILESISFINNKIKATSIIGVKLLHGILTTIYIRLLLCIFPLYQATSITLKTTTPSTNQYFVAACLLSVTVLLILHRISRQAP